MSPVYDESSQYDNLSYSYEGQDLVWDNLSSSYDSSDLSYDGYPLREASGSGSSSSESSWQKLYITRSATDSASGSSNASFAYLVASSAISQGLGSSNSSGAILRTRSIAGYANGSSSVEYQTNETKRQVSDAATSSELTASNKFIPSVQPWNDSYYSVTFNANGYKFYGLDVEPSIAQAAIFLESNLIAEAYEIQYPEIQATASASVFVSAIEIQYASSSLDGLLSNIVVALEEQRALITIEVESSLVSVSMKDAYASSSLSGDVGIIPSAMEILYAQATAQDISGSATITAIEILYAVVDPASIESNFTADSTRVRVVSASLSIETSVNVGSYKFARALIDSLVDANLSVAKIYKETWAYIAFDGEASVTPRAIEILYAQVDPMSSEADVSTTAIEILYAVPEPTSAESSASITAYEIQYALIDLAIDGYVLTVAQEILYPEIQIDIESNFTATSYKIAYAEFTANVEASVDTVAMEILYAKQLIEVESNVSPTSTKIAYASSDLSIEGYKVVVGKEILFAKISVGITSNVIFVTPIRFSPSIVEDTQSIRTLLLLDDKPLTEHNRTFSMSVNKSFVENNNWNNSRNRYYKTNGTRRSLSISWSFVPNNRENTVDLKFGRDMIKRIATDPDVHTLRYLNIDSDGTTPYTEQQFDVIVKNYSEKLIRRDLDSDVYFWDCNLELEEI